MKFIEFLENTRRTWAELDTKTDNLNHALLGIADEVGELSKQYKKALVYEDKKLDIDNVKEELGDLLFFTARVIDELNYEAIDKVCEAIQQVIDNDYGKLRKQQDSVTEVGAVLFLANKATNINAAVGTEDGGIILRSVHELVYGACWLASIYSFNVGDIMDSNIRKLKVRYPDKFSKDKALNRDLEAEMKAVKGKEDGKDTD